MPSPHAERSVVVMQVASYLHISVVSPNQCRRPQWQAGDSCGACPEIRRQGGCKDGGGSSVCGVRLEAAAGGGDTEGA